MMPVEPLRPERFEEASRTLTRAFFNDPGVMYIFPEEQRREKLMCFFHRYSAAVFARLGGAFITSGGEGVAFWIPPPLRAIPTWHFLRAGLWRAPFVLGLRGIRRPMLFQNDIDRRMKEDLDGPHWILDVLGVDPAHHGKGIGSALIRHISDRADEEGIPCYLITHTEKNVAFYNNHGFQLLKAAPSVPGSSLTTYSLRRPPASANKTA
jgi:GNAT superfamily N-acetyltransferase